MSQEQDSGEIGCYLVLLAILIVVGIITEYHDYIWNFICK